MYGSIARFRVKPGMVEEFQAWNQENQMDGPDGPGIMLVFQMDRDPNELFGVFAAESEAVYRSMSEDPATHERYLQMLRFLESEPEWHDGHVVAYEVAV